MENWKEVENYKGLYEVSNLGNVRSITHEVQQKNSHGGLSRRIYRGKNIKPRISKNGYYYLHLSKNGVRKTYKIHRLVAKTFIPNPKNKEIVNHKNGNKLDNVVQNLEWCTVLENIRHAWKLGLCFIPSGKQAYNFKGTIGVFKDDVLIDTLNGFKDMNSKGYRQSCVFQQMKGNQKQHKGCTFKYLEKNYE